MRQVHTLRFGGSGDLARAFDHILSSPDVDSCVVDAAQDQVRFFARSAPAEKLIERIYQDGGLVWCTSHRLEQRD